MTKKYVTGILGLFCTLFSLYAGLRLYLILYPSEVAWTLIFILELARLTCLYYAIWLQKYIAWLLYPIIIGVCFLNAVAYLTTQIEMQKEQEQQKYKEQIILIKNTAKQQQEQQQEQQKQQLNDLLFHVAENKGYQDKYKDDKESLAKWNKLTRQREEQVKQKRAQIEAIQKTYDTIIKADPTNPRLWIEEMSVKLNVKITIKKEKIDIFEKSLKDLWGWDIGKAKKVFGIAATVMIELLIIALALATYRNGNNKEEQKGEIKQQKATEPNNRKQQNRKHDYFCDYCGKRFEKYKGKAGHLSGNTECAIKHREQKQKEEK